MKKAGIILLIFTLFVACSQEIPSWYSHYPVEQGDIISVSLRFETGTSFETKETNGLTRLTLQSVLKNSTRETPWEDIQQRLNDMAVSEKIITDTEVSSFVFRFHKDHFEDWFSLLRERFESPRFSEEETAVLRREMRESLENRILYRSEDLSRDILVRRLYRDHPYEHLPAGHPYSLGNLIWEDVAEYWNSRFSVHNLNLAVSGPLTREQEKALITFFSDFHSGVRPDRPSVNPPVEPDTLQYIFIDNGSDVSALSLGWHIPYSPSDPAFYPLWIFASWLGEHRTFYGHLMQELRVKRGFNYGDYAYAGHFVQNTHSVFPQPGHPRNYHYFSVWVRPLANQNIPFALRLILYDLASIQETGIDSVSYENTKQFLKSYTKMYARNRGDFLGFEQDHAYYGLSSYPMAWETMLDSIPWHNANEIIRENINTDKMVVVVVGGETDSLKQIIQSGSKTPPVYRTSPDKNVRERDNNIMAYPFPPGHVEQYGTLDFLQY